jgi:hypothetical protein
MPDKHCEHREDGSGNPSCAAPAIFTVARGRKHDAQLSCRRHLAATVEALAEGQNASVTLTLVHAPGQVLIRG